MNKTLGILTLCLVMTALVLSIALPAPEFEATRAIGALGGLLGLGQLGSLLGQKSGGPKIVSRFQKELRHKDWWDATLETDTSGHEITCTTGHWTKIGRNQVSPRRRSRFGYGNPNQPDNQGYLYIAIYDDTATNSVLEEGAIRLVHLGYDDYPRFLIGEWPTTSLRGSATLRTQKVALPETSYPWVYEDSYLVIEFNPDATDDVIAIAIGTAAGLDLWNIPATIETLAV